MSLLEWAIQAALVLALLLALPMALRLERALSALRQDREAMANSMKAFAEATREADGAILRLRAAADSVGRSIAEKTASAQTLHEDLRFLTDRAEGLAERLDSVIRAARGSPPAQAGTVNARVTAPPASSRPSPEIGAATRARAEEDLLQALIRKRPQ
ncbi:hypothetical protein J8J14_22135 [Roseomonas sp. SSH11]|uniref:DUF6468 domain-containing protein n=1 Tax=Pararoseomonas baculiformis TaxID=2820812 RepID=A0ABS4AKA9_9PROT|nr:DUF6468 domain-containing protein [Pararoseomonas baculiformis]MBP0447464.1 hypothetical protein [Pararoseomonas baculiformis]